MDKYDTDVMRKHVCNSCHKNVGSDLNYVTILYDTTRYKVLIC